MKRVYSCFSHPDLQVFKATASTLVEALCSHCSLDSNDYPHTKNQWMILYWQQIPFHFRQNSNKAFETLQKQIDIREDWLFGYLSYDLKNDLEALESKHKDSLEFPELYFFSPNDCGSSKAVKWEVIMYRLVIPKRTGNQSQMLSLNKQHLTMKLRHFSLVFQKKSIFIRCWNRNNTSQEVISMKLIFVWGVICRKRQGRAT